MSVTSNPVGLAVLACLALAPGLACADMLVQRKVDGSKIIIQGPEVADLREGNLVRIESDGSVGRVARVKGNRASVILGTTDFVREGDSVVFERAGRAAAGSVAPEASASRTFRTRRFHGASESNLSLNLLLGGNYATLPSTLQGVDSKVTVLPEVALDVRFTRIFAMNFGLGYVQKTVGLSFGMNSLPEGSSIGGVEMKKDDTLQLSGTVSYLQFTPAARFRPTGALVISAAPYVAFPVASSAEVAINGKKISDQSSAEDKGPTDVGAVGTLGLALPIGSSLDLLIEGRYAHGFVDDVRTRDFRGLAGLSIGL